MTETQSAGIKEFFIAVFWTLILFFLGGSTSYAMPVYKVVSGIMTFIIFCVFAFFVLTRYSAVFTYSLHGNKLRVNRKIGKREKEVEIKTGNIVDIVFTDPKLKPTYRMRKYILRHKADCYIIYNDKNGLSCLLFSPSNEMIKKIKKSMKKDNQEE